MDDPCYYGFPTYGEPTVKAAQDVGGPVIDVSDPLSRTSLPDADMLRSARCSHALPAARLRRARPVAALPVHAHPRPRLRARPGPGHPSVVVGLGAAHGFKFAPTFGRILADLALSGSTTSDVSPFTLDRPALTDPDYAAHWLV